ncbi:hypothetical protein EBB07_03685 [Paenibacillaceae bacterium]|nr:hypothetical protein EBB07_03685 [Paenibacillaceae bacterium]
MRFKYVIITVVLIAASWIGNWMYYEKMKMGEPIFLEHNYELSGLNGEMFDIFFLEDRDADVTVTSVEFPNTFGMQSQLLLNKDTYGHQVLRKVSFTLKSAEQEMDETDEVDELDETWTIDERWKTFDAQTVHVYYSNGTTKEVNIGRVRVMPRPSTVEQPFEFSSGGSSSDHSGFQSMTLSSPLVIQSIKSPAADQLDEWLGISLNITAPFTETDMLQGMPKDFESGTPIKDISLPLELEKGQALRIDHKFRFPADLTVAAALVPSYIAIHFEGELENGKPFHYSYNLRYQPYFRNSEIRELIRLRRAANE